MATVGSIIDALGGTKEVAELLSCAPSTVSGWRSRGIPGDAWAPLAEAAQAKGLADVTVDLLARLHARAPREAAHP